MPWVDSRNRIHRFDLLTDGFTVAEIARARVACSCGWQQGLRSIAFDQHPWYQWEQNHLRKIRPRTFLHDSDDIHYDYEDRRARCECGWESPPGAAFEKSGRVHVEALRAREGSR